MGLLGGPPTGFTARRVHARLLAGELEDVLTQLSEEIDMADKDAADKAADDAAERGRRENARMATEVKRQQDEADAEARRNWS